MPRDDFEVTLIEIEMGRVILDLSRLNIDVGDGVPEVGPRDSLRVAHLKERLLLLRRQRTRALSFLAEADGCGGDFKGLLH